MPKYNTDYLKFDAYSVKEALIKRLSNNDTFTDQLFEGSNLVTFIDTFSHLFELFMYYINHGASDSIFSDSQLYENINRIVKLIGYNPLGGLSSNTTISFYNEDDQVDAFTDSVQKEIPKYSGIDTGLIDSKGNNIYYSLVNRLFVSKQNPENEINTFNAVNGRWKVYERTFFAEGIPFEEFTLSNLNIDTDTQQYIYIAHPYIDVFVKTTDENTGESIFEEYAAVQEGNIFGNNSSILTPASKRFELRINENKRYSIKFGDDIHGKKLKKGDEIYVVYLEGNGPEGEIGALIIDDVGVVSSGIAGIDNNTFLQMLGLSIEDSDVLIDSTEMQTLHFKNVKSSTTYQSLESVESIRQNAPTWAKGNNRLITKEDFEQFMRIYHGSDIYDVNVMNQWTYASTFYYWLNLYDKLTVAIRSVGYPYSDACDFNNVYIWVKTKGVELNESVINEEMQNKKALTCEPKLLSAIDNVFVPCLNFSADNIPSYDNNIYDFTNWDSNFENWIEIIKTKDSYISAEKIRSQVIIKLKNFFDPSVNEIGGVLNLNTLYSNLLSTDGVKTIRMAYKPTGGTESDTIYYNGMSFAKWTPVIIEGRDIDIVKGTIQLESFQFPYLLESNLNSRIKIFTESFNQTSIEF